VSVTVEDVRGMSDEQLRERWAADADASVLAEARRRDQADRAARERAQVRAEWYDAAHEQFLAAEAQCCGNLLSRDGEAAGITNPFQLWAGRADVAAKYASEELNDFWRVSPRVTIGEYIRQMQAGNRLAREDMTEEAGDDGSVDTYGRDGLDGDAARGLRHERGPGAVRGAGDAGGAEAGADGAARAGGSAVADHGRRGEAGVSDATDAATAARVAADTARHMEAGREAAERRLAAARAAAGMTGAVVPRPTAAPVRPRADRIPGDQLLDLLRQWIGTYVRLPSPAALDVMVAWVAHSHMKDENGTLVFRATPRLYFLSSEPGSGKSKCLELLNMLCPDTFGLDLEPTKAGLIHTLSKEHATVLLDEGDLLFSSAQRASGVRAVLNGGYARHGTTVNGKGNKATRVNVFGAVALAGLDAIEKATGNSMDALLSRGFKIRMKRAGKNDRPAKVSRVAEGQAAKLNEWLQAWASQVRDELADYQPDMPEELDGRAEEISTPLVAVADAAGGEWPERVRAAVVELALDQATAPVEDEGKSAAEEFASFAADLGGALENTELDYTGEEE